MNCLRALLNRLADAASYWLQTPVDAADELWANLKPRDGADRLAEREAETESTEPRCDTAGCDGTFESCFLLNSAAPDIRSSVDAADGPRGTAAQPETRAGHPICSAQNPALPDKEWAKCFWPLGHTGSHGYGGKLWYTPWDNDPQ